jgi:hypothetical protein
MHHHPSSVQNNQTRFNGLEIGQPPTADSGASAWTGLCLPTIRLWRTRCASFAPAGAARVRGGAPEVHHVGKRAQGGSDFDLDRLMALCPPCHAYTDAPYARGRLVITPIGPVRFTVEVARGISGRSARSRRPTPRGSRFGRNFSSPAGPCEDHEPGDRRPAGSARLLPSCMIGGLRSSAPSSGS